MKDEWFPRLIAAIESDRRSYRQLSEDAGLGQNYIQQMIKDGKQPTAPKLEAILNALGGAKSVEILLGLEMSESDMEALRLLNAAPKSIRSSVMDLLRAAKSL